MSIDERISEALRRLVAGMGAMRIPADPCDADLVLSDVQTELATLRAQLATVTRERDSWRAQRDEVHAEMERQTQLKREERQAKLDAMRERDEAQAVLRKCHEVAWPRGGDLNGDPVCDLMLMRGTFQAHITTLERERDEARADAARLREALTQVRDAMRATGQEPDGDDDPRRPVASAVWHALDSTPSAEPTPREMRDDAELPLPTGPRPDSERLAWLLSGMPKVGRTSVDLHVFDELRAEVNALRADSTPLLMRVAEAVREACVETADASDEVSRRVAGDLRDLNLAAVVAKAVKP